MTRRRRAPLRSTLAAASAALGVHAVLLDRCAPAQEPPGRAFSLGRPLGWASHAQLARIGCGQALRQAALSAGQVAFTPSPRA